MTQTTSGGTGGCLCGAVRYRYEGEPTAVGLCQCERCQRQSREPKQQDHEDVQAPAVWFGVGIRIIVTTRHRGTVNQTAVERQTWEQKAE